MIVLCLRSLVLGLSILGLLATAGCGDEKKATKPDDATGPEHSLVFTRDPADSPVVSSGEDGWPIFPTDPCLIADEEGYHLFYTSYFCNAGGSYHYSWDVDRINACNILDVVATVGYAFSPDRGYTWVFRGPPVVMPGDEAWQCGDLETPHVARLGDTLYLFYSATGTLDGAPFPERYQVGVATLDLAGNSVRERLLDGGTEFSRRSQPLLPYNLTASAYNNSTQEPSVVIRDGRIELFYVGVRFAEPRLPAEHPDQRILGFGLARAVFSEDLRPIEASPDWILPDANIPEVKYFDGGYWVFSTVGTDGEFHRQERIQYHWSRDAVTFTPGVDLLLPEREYDSWGVMAPTVVVEDEALVMLYTGWSRAGHPCFPEPLPPGTRFGRPSEGDTSCIYGCFARATAPRPTAP